MCYLWLQTSTTTTKNPLTSPHFGGGGGFSWPIYVGGGGVTGGVDITPPLLHWKNRLIDGGGEVERCPTPFADLPGEGRYTQNFRSVTPPPVFCVVANCQIDLTTLGPKISFRPSNDKPGQPAYFFRLSFAIVARSRMSAAPKLAIFIRSATTS